MAVKYGFYDSINKDRVYSAIDMSSIFEGVICDGIFRHVGKAFALASRDGVTDGLTVKIKSGRAWLAHTYFVNQNDFSITLPNNSTVLVGIEVNRLSRSNTLKYVTVADTSVVNPPGYNPKPDSPNRSEDLYINESYKYFYPLYRMVTKNNAVSSVQDLRGTSACPWARNTDQGSLEAAIDQANARFDEISEQISGAGITALTERITAAERDLNKLAIRTHKRGVAFIPWRQWFPYYIDVPAERMHVFVSGIYLSDENNSGGVYTMGDATDTSEDKYIYIRGGVDMNNLRFDQVNPDVGQYGAIGRERTTGEWYGGEITPATAGITLSFHRMVWMGSLASQGFVTLSGGIIRSSEMDL